MTEANATVNVTVLRSGDKTAAVDVDYATGPGTTATVGELHFTPGTLPFASGESSKTFPVTIIDNTTFDPPNKKIVFSSRAPSTSPGAVREQPDDADDPRQRRPGHDRLRPVGAQRHRERGPGDDHGHAQRQPAAGRERPLRDVQRQRDRGRRLHRELGHSHLQRRRDVQDLPGPDRRRPGLRGRRGPQPDALQPAEPDEPGPAADARAKYAGALTIVDDDVPTLRLLQPTYSPTRATARRRSPSPAAARRTCRRPSTTASTRSPRAPRPAAARTTRSPMAL